MIVLHNDPLMQTYARTKADWSPLASLTFHPNMKGNWQRTLNCDKFEDVTPLTRCLYSFSSKQMNSLHRLLCNNGFMPKVCHSFNILFLLWIELALTWVCGIINFLGDWTNSRLLYYFFCAKLKFSLSVSSN